MSTHLSLINDQKAEAINGGFLNTTVNQNANNASASVGQGFFVGIGTLGKTTSKSFSLI